MMEQVMMMSAMAMPQRRAGYATQGASLEDPELAAALEQSYSAGTRAGQAMTEDEMLMQAIRDSQMEEENRQRQLLREQQEAELQESMLMDQMRAAEAEQRRNSESR